MSLEPHSSQPFHTSFFHLGNEIDSMFLHSSIVQFLKGTEHTIPLPGRSTVLLVSYVQILTLFPMEGVSVAFSFWNFKWIHSFLSPYGAMDFQPIWVNPKNHTCWIIWYEYIWFHKKLPALRKLRKEDLGFEASLGYSRREIGEIAQWVNACWTSMRFVAIGFLVMIFNDPFNVHDIDSIFSLHFSINNLCLFSFSHSLARGLFKLYSSLHITSLYLVNLFCWFLFFISWISAFAIYHLFLYFRFSLVLKYFHFD